MNDEVYYDEETLFKVNRALRASGLTQVQTQDAIIEMQNAGILFRERQKMIEEQNRVLLILSFDIVDREDIWRIVEQIASLNLPVNIGDNHIVLEPLVSKIEDLLKEQQ